MSYSTATTQRPAGITVLVFISAFFTLIGYFATIASTVFGAASIGVGAEGGAALIIFLVFFTLFVGAYMLVLYGLYKMNRTAYYIMIVLTALSFVLSLIGLNIIGMAVQGAILAYLLMVNGKF